jgi:hypothetical protein
MFDDLPPSGPFLIVLGVGFAMVVVIGGLFIYF